MPIYEYSCPQCESRFELLIRGNEAAKCPQCGGQRLDKLISLPAAHTSGDATLPTCEGPRPGPCGMGGCGLPECD